MPQSTRGLSPSTLASQLAVVSAVVVEGEGRVQLCRVDERAMYAVIQVAEVMDNNVA